MQIAQPGNIGGIEFVFLDRDGVINRKAPESEYVSEWDDFELLPGVETAIATLNHSGRCVIIVSNQRGVSLGIYNLEQVAALHGKLQDHLAKSGAHIDAFYVCPHGHNACNCRKPKPGLLEEAFKDFPAATKKNSVLIGDSLSDIQLARNFGIPSIFIADADEQDSASQEASKLALAIASSLQDAVDRYLSVATTS